MQNLEKSILFIGNWNSRHQAQYARTGNVRTSPMITCYSCEREGHTARFRSSRVPEKREQSRTAHCNTITAAKPSIILSVSPDAKYGLDTAERSRQMIQESKFLGGNIEHTHLVKGLDYALIQKMRCEINYKEKEEE
ncbi:protein Red [Nephila pilipes]|uniref:Protein Red n=1 Tax=Nephila pilipes TaxID=299642 RepID=A0A8X6QKT2_NEPPI|nr:protein Red [Nephila pilipes]